MKLIIALIQPHRLEAVKAALSEVEVSRLTVSHVQGYGRQKGHTEFFRGQEMQVNLLPKTQLTVAVNDEFVPFHMDDEAGYAAKNEQGAFGMGNLRYNYLLNMLRDWAGDEAEIREVGCSYRSINQKHDVLTCTGKITEKTVEGGDNLVRLDLNVINQDGQGTCPGHAVVVLPSRP